MSDQNKRYFAVQIEYKSFDNEVKMHRLVNYTPGQLAQFRDGIFKMGLRILVEPGVQEIICPASIRAIRIYQQAHFFNAAEEDKPITNGKTIVK